jgi:hypothetical protein
MTVRVLDAPQVLRSRLVALALGCRIDHHVDDRLHVEVRRCLRRRKVSECGDVLLDERGGRTGGVAG